MATDDLTPRLHGLAVVGVVVVLMQGVSPRSHRRLVAVVVVVADGSGCHGTQLGGGVGGVPALVPAGGEGGFHSECVT